MTNYVKFSQLRSWMKTCDLGQEKVIYGDGKIDRWVWYDQKAKFVARQSIIFSFYFATFRSQLRIFFKPKWKLITTQPNLRNSSTNHVKGSVSWIWSLVFVSHIIRVDYVTTWCCEYVWHLHLNKLYWEGGWNLFLVDQIDRVK